MRKRTIAALFCLAVTGLSAEERLDLSGEWRITFSDQAGFKDPSWNTDSWQTIHIPSSWTTLQPDKELAWLRKTFVAPPDFPRMNRALAFTVYDADETYLNGVLIGASAVIESPDSHAYGVPRIYSIPAELLKTGENVLSVRIRSHLGRRGIAQDEAVIGDLHALEHERALGELRQISFGCIYLTAGLYFLLFFLRMPAIRAHLFFAVFCLLLSLYILLRAQVVAEAFGFLEMKRLEYIVLFCMPIPFFAFWAALFRYRQPWYVLVLYLSMAAFIYFPLSSNRVEIWNAMLGRWYFLLGIGAAAVVWLLFGEIRRGSRLAGMLLLGTLLFLASIINDILLDRVVYRGPHLSEYGFLAFVVSMAASLVQSFVTLQRQSEESLQRLTEMDQLKERLVSNATAVLLSPAALMLSVASRLRGGARKTNADYEELQRYGLAMNEALDGVLLLSRIQSGVEAAAFHVLTSDDLARIRPQISWPGEIRILGTESLLRFLLQADDSKQLEISWQNEAGLTIVLSAPVQGSPESSSSLRENMIREAVKALRGDVFLRPDGSRALQIPPAPPETPWAGRFENLSSVKTTALPRLGLSLCFLLIFAYLSHPVLVFVQAAHLLAAAASLVLLWIAWKPGSRLALLARSEFYAYARSFADMIQVSIAAYATGGLDSPWLLGFAIPVVFSSFRKDRWRGRFVAGAGALLAFASEAASTLGFLPDINVLGKGETPTEFWQTGLHSALMAAGLGMLAEVTNRLYRSALRSQEEAQLARERAEKLNEFVRGMNENSDLSKMIEKIILHLQSVFRIDSLILLLPDQQTGELVSARAFTTSNMDPELVDAAQNLRVPSGAEGGIVRAAFERAKPLYIRIKGPRDIFRRPYPGIERDRQFVEKMRFEWFLLVPLVIQERSIGLVLCTSYRRPEGLTRTETQEVEGLCEQVTGAVHWVDMIRQTALERDRAESMRKAAEDAREETQKLAQFSRSINESADLKKILGEVFDYIRTAFGAEDIVLQLADESRQELHTVQWSSDRPLSAEQREFISNLKVPLNESGGVLYRTYQKQKPLHVARKFISPDAGIDRLIMETLQLQSFAQFPLVIQKQTIGILWLSFGEERRSPEQIESMARFCDQVAGAVHSARLLADAELARVQAEAAGEAAQEARNDLERMADFTRRMNETTNLDEIASGVFSYLRGRFGLERCAILLVDEEQSEIRGAAVETAGPTKTFWETFKVPLVPETGTLYKTYLRRRPLYLRRISKQGLGQVDLDIIAMNNLKSFIQVPLVVQEKTAGIVVADATRFLRGSEVEAIARLCDQIAGAVQHARLLEVSRKARAESEMLRSKADSLNALFADLARQESMQEIMGRVMAHINRQHGVKPYYSLYSVDADQKWIRCWAIEFPPEAGEKEKQRVIETPIPLDAANGVFSQTFRRGGKPAYFARIRGGAGLEIEQFITQLYRMEDFFLLPVVESGRIIAFLNLTSGGANGFSSEVRADLVRLADQIGGIIRTQQLLLEVEQARKESEKSREESDRILANILPVSVAAELKREGQVEPLFYDSVSVLFTDFVGFTQASENLLPDELVAELDGCFSQFDAVVKRNNMEKLKTIGDSYMCAGGLPQITDTHAVDACLTALEFRSFMITTEEIKKSLGMEFWQIRIGIHTGPVTAGVIGTNKFAYDIWGDTVNTASRMESSGAPGMVNISGETYALVKEFFDCEYRGKVKAKGKGEVDMYFLQRIKPELSADEAGLLPNARFEMMRMGIQNG